jgi:hypothetical protein
MQMFWGLGLLKMGVTQVACLSDALVVWLHGFLSALVSDRSDRCC